MVLYRAFLYFVVASILISPSLQEKSSTSHQHRTTSSLKKLSQPKIKTQKFKLDLKMDDTLSSLSFQNTPTKTSGKVTSRESRDLLKGSVTTSRLGSSWYGFDNYVPRKGRSIPITVGTAMRKSYVIGEGMMKNNNNNNNNNNINSINNNNNNVLTSSQYYRQNEQPELKFNLVVPQFQVDNMYQPKMQDQGSYFGSLLDMAKENNLYKSTKSNSNSYYQTNYAPVRAMPIPVVIKIIPLKMSSSYLAEALKTMNFIPLPMSLFNVLRESMHYNNINDEPEEEEPKSQMIPQRNEGYVRYDDPISHMTLTRDPESLPRPSSHVATPLDTPPSTSRNKPHLGVSYLDEDAMRLDYDNRFRKRTTTTTV